MKKGKKENGNMFRSVIALFLCFLVMCLILFTAFSLNKDAKSVINSEESVYEYLKGQYTNDEFEINEHNTQKKTLNKGQYAISKCNITLNTWSVTSKKTGVSFEIHDNIIKNIHGEQICSLNVSDNYEENIRKDIIKNYSSDKNASNPVFNLKDYNSKEELAKQLDTIIDKYLLKENYYNVNINLIVKNNDKDIYIKYNYESLEDLQNQIN